MTALPYTWIEKIETALQDLQEIPLWGAPPPFPWEDLSKLLEERISLENVKVSFNSTQFRSYEDLLAGLGVKPVILSFELSPLPAEGFWVIGIDDVAKLSAAILPTSSPKGFSDPRLQEGFYRYLCLEAIQAMNEMGAFEDLNLKMADFTSLPQQGALCIDVSLSFGEKTIWARAICPTSFHSAFKSHFSQRKPSLANSELAAKVEIPLTLEIGHVQLSKEQWKKVQVGDFLLLERASFDPNMHKGTVSIVLNKTPLFQAKCKDNHLKILDYAFYYEEEIAMDTPPFDHESDKDEERDEELPSEEQMFNEEMFLEKELEQELTKPEEEHLWTEKKEPSGSLEKIVSAEEIPLALTVEVGKLQMTLEKLLQLQPGNVIELPVKPEQGVSLTVNGKKVAHGELVIVGEALGVKILQIGK